MSQVRRILTPYRLAILGAALLFLFLPWWFGREPPPTVRTAEVVRGPLEVRVTTNGKIEPLPDAELEVRARLDGRVLYVPDPGTAVRAGAEILRIEQEAVAAELAAAESERVAAEESLRAAGQEVAIAQRRFATDEKLFRQHALTRDRYAESAAARDEAVARLAALEKEVPLRMSGLDLRILDLRERLAAAVVAAPFDGTVYRTAVKKGELVRVGDPILWFADLRRLRVRANIDQVDLGRVRPGQTALVGANAFPGRTWTGNVSEVIPHVFFRENRSISEGLADLAPPTEGLVPGMTVDVEIVVSRESDALQVPAEAVIAKEKESFVYRVERTRLRKSAVKLGLTNERAVQIVDGIAAGERVVVGSKQDLFDGMKVRADERDGGPPTP